MRALKRPRRRVHHRLVELFGVEVRTVHIKRVLDARIVDAVGVFYFLTREDRVEILRYFKRLAHDDILGRVRVAGKGQALDRDAGIGVEVGNVALGVHARVRAAAADELHIPAADL